MNNAGASTSLAAHSSVCDVCQGFGDLNNPRGYVSKVKPYDKNRWRGDFVYTYVHYANIELAAASAKAGCEVCDLICDGLERPPFRGSEHSQDDADSSAARDSAQSDPVVAVVQSDEDVLTASQLAELARREGISTPADLDAYGHGRVILQVYSRKEYWPRDDQLYFHEQIFVQTTSGLFCRLSFFNSSGDPLDPHLEHRPARDLLSEAHIGLINRWRRTCETEHESCNKTDGNHPQHLPSRVLELLDPSDEKKGIRLVETQGKMLGIYACLSYCWGDPKTQIGQTCRGNLTRQLQGIPFHDLPNTIIDAIHLCFKLGLRFLWVDRLCILQDDILDWSLEASKMCDVYSRSALTISVPLCEESSQSFLAERSEGFREQKQHSIITYTERNSEWEGSLWIDPRGNSEEEGAPSEGPWFLERPSADSVWIIDPDHARSRWLQRGWTFQEWMLSPRVLHIDSMTLWDCFEGNANELNRRHIEHTEASRKPTSSDPSPFDGGLSWDAAVNEYSQREVSYERDRLPALAGLAARFALAKGYTYLAGLWLEEMPRSLLWVRDDVKHEPYLHADRNVPSWSWASYDRPVIYFRFGGSTLGKFTATASILSTFCQYDPPDSFSAVVKAWLDVNGLVSIVTEQDKVDCRIKAGDTWWNPLALIPEYRLRVPEDEIAQANVYLLILGFDGFYYHGALVLQGCGWEDGRQCLRRLGVVHLRETSVHPSKRYLNDGFGPSYKARTVRLV